MSNATPAQQTLLTYEWCRTPDAGLPAPDLTLFLDIDPEVAKARGGYGEERYEKEELQARVREVFQRIGADVVRSGGRWISIDAGRGMDEVTNDIWEKVEQYANGTEEPIRSLWPAGQINH